MQDMALYSQKVVVPLLLNVYQRPLPGTEPEVLNSREHKHIVIAVHHGVNRFQYFLHQTATH